MTCSANCPASDGIIPSNTRFSTGPTTRAGRTKANPPIAPNALERLAQLVNSNDRLMDELVTSRARIVAARTYLDRPGCHVKFGTAHLERCRIKHSGILGQLRANRIEALRLLGEGRSDD